LAGFWHIPQEFVAGFDPRNEAVGVKGMVFSLFHVCFGTLVISFKHNCYKKSIDATMGGV
jgi:hypothetical protein